MGRRRAKPSLARRGRRGATHAELGAWRLHAEDGARCCSARTRRTTSGCSACRHSRIQGRDQRPRGARRAAEPRRTGTKGAAHHVLEIPAGGSGDPVRAAADARTDATRSGRLRRGARARGARRPTRSTPRSSRRRWTPTARWSCARRWPGCCGASSTTSTTSTAGCASTASTRGTRTRGATCATPSGSTWSPATSSRCRTSGSTRGSRRGTWPSTARRCRSSTSTSPRSRSSCCCARATCTRTAQIPAYEWNFGDVNPPVTAWAALCVYEREAEIRGEGDREFLARVFQRLLTNFTWWVNRKDPDGRNLFQGGFLGLDNIGIFDRSAPLPGGGTLRAGRRHGVDGALLPVDAADRGGARPRGPELRRHGAEVRRHFEWIAIALNPPGADTPLWDEEDGFFYDVMRMPDGTTIPLQGALARRAAAAVRGDGVRGRRGRAPPRAARARAGVRRALRRRRAGARPPARPERRGPPAARARRRGAAAADPRP